MKTKLGLILAATLLAWAAVPGLAETKEGKCTLKEAKFSTNDKVVKVEVGEHMKATCKFYIDQFIEAKIINANISVKNASDKPMFYQYYVAFFDKDGALIGCTGQGTVDDEKGLAAGESENTSSCLIPLPEGFHEKAVSYKIAFYESDKPIGKK